MDEVVTVRRSFLNKIRGFLNMFAEQCRTCLRKNPWNCADCHTVNRARALIVDIDTIRNAEEERYYIENPFTERAARAVRAIRQAGRPLTIGEIDMGSTVTTRQHKHIVMQRLVKLGYLDIGKDVNGHYVYSEGRMADSI